MARDFNGVGDRIDWAAIHNLTGSPITISLWTYLDVRTNSDWLFTIHSAGDTNYGIVLILLTDATGGQLNLFRRGTTDCDRWTSNNQIATGGWHNVIATHDGTFNDYTKIHIYVDGVECDYTGGGGTNGAGEVAATGSWSVGGRIYSDTRNMDGRLAEVGVWDAVVDAATITGLAAGYPPDCYGTNLVFYCDLDGANLTDQITSTVGVADGTAQIASPAMLSCYVAGSPVEDILVESVSPTEREVYLASRTCGTEYSVWLLHPATGVNLDLVEEYQAIDYVKNTNNYGAFTLTLPATFDLSLVQEDTRVVVWRKPHGGARAIDFCGFVRKISKSQRGASQYWTLFGYDLNFLLDSRIVAYAAGETEASKSGAADDMMKEIVYENLGAGCTDTDRDLSGFDLTIQADATVGTSIQKQFAWRNVLEVLREIADASHSTETTAVYFGIVPLVNGWDCEFRTNIVQFGKDHRYPSGAAGAVIFSVESENITNVDRISDWTEERTYAYAGGQGEGAARVIKEAEDTTRSGVSPFNRREVFIDARNETADAAVQDAADEGARMYRPKNTFNGSVVTLNTGNYVYGRDYQHGDYVTAVYMGETIDCRIETVRVTINDGKENIEIGLRSES